MNSTTTNGINPFPIYLPPSASVSTMKLSKWTKAALTAGHAIYPSSHFHEKSIENQPSSTARKDTVLLKRMLADALGADGSSYWVDLRDYLVGRISKSEFDAKASKLLGPNGISSTFIM